MPFQYDWALLPHNVLVQLFSFMSREDALSSSSVCIHWRRAVYRLPNVWKRLSIDAANFAHEDVFSCPAIYCCQSVCINFDPNDLEQLHSVQNLLTYLQYNRKLRALALKPLSINLDWNLSYYRNLDDNTNENLSIKSFCDALCGLIQSCPNLEHLSLGLSNGFIGWQNHVLFNLRAYQLSSLKSLHIPYLRSNFDDDDSIPYIGCSLLTSFNLTRLTLNYDHISEDLLFRLTRQENPGKLESLTIFVNDACDFPEIRKPVWRHVVQSCPRLKVTLNLVHAYVACEQLPQLLAPAMPLAHLRLYFCGRLNVDLIRQISDLYAETLEGLHVVDCFDPNTGQPSHYKSARGDAAAADGDPYEPDPFVILAWKCAKLKELVLVGYWISCINLTGITALRGNTLRRLEVPDFCLELEEEDTEAIARLEDVMSTNLAWPWRPLTLYELEWPLFAPEDDNTEMVFLPQLLADMDWSGENM